MSILSNIKILKDLDKNELDQLELLCQERFIKAGEVIFNKGDDANSMYLLKEGEIEVFINQNGEEVVIGTIKAEDILGEMAIFGEENKKRMASARAKQDSVIIVMLEFAIKELINQHPELLKKIQKIIEKRQEENKQILK